MIMQVHDELVFEVPLSEVEWLRTEIPRLMAGVAELRVPLLAEVGVGPNWDKAHGLVPAFPAVLKIHHKCLHLSLASQPLGDSHAEKSTKRFRVPAPRQ
jgi:hypothetical protein